MSTRPANHQQGVRKKRRGLPRPLKVLLGFIFITGLLIYAWLRDEALEDFSDLIPPPLPVVASELNAAHFLERELALIDAAEDILDDREDDGGSLEGVLYGWNTAAQIPAGNPTLFLKALEMPGLEDVLDEATSREFLQCAQESPVRRIYYEFKQLLSARVVLGLLRGNADDALVDLERLRKWILLRRQGMTEVMDEHLLLYWASHPVAGFARIKRGTRRQLRKVLALTEGLEASAEDLSAALRSYFVHNKEWLERLSRGEHSISSEVSPWNFKLHRTLNRFARQSRRFIELTKEPYVQWKDETEDRREENKRSWRTWFDSNSLGTELTPVHTFALIHALNLQGRAKMRCARVLVALRLHELEHGSLPDTLDALAPAILDTVPLDPFTDESLVYDRERRIVYSVGLDLEDQSFHRKDPGFQLFLVDPVPALLPENP